MLIEEMVEVGIGNKNVKHYEDLGYEIPRYTHKLSGELRVKNGTKIMVKSTDVPKKSQVKVRYQCDNKVDSYFYRHMNKYMGIPEGVFS